MAVVYHAVVIRRADGSGGATSEYGVVGIVDNSGISNPNFVYDLTTDYGRAERVAAALNGGI